jgi:hypothetical protein
VTRLTPLNVGDDFEQLAADALEEVRAAIVKKTMELAAVRREIDELLNRD